MKQLIARAILLACVSWLGMSAESAQEPAMLIASGLSTLVMLAINAMIERANQRIAEQIKREAAELDNDFKRTVLAHDEAKDAAESVHYADPNVETVLKSVMGPRAVARVKAIRKGARK